LPIPEIARAAAGELHCDVEEIVETRKRRGVIEFVKTCYEALRGHHALIETFRHDPQAYDLILVGTPVWAASVSTPVRSYLASHRASLPDVAFFCTQGHQGIKGAFADMAKIAGKPPRAVCAVTASVVAAGAMEPSVTRFAADLGVPRGRVV
jgi:hypothetical protein